MPRLARPYAGVAVAVTARSRRVRAGLVLLSLVVVATGGTACSSDDSTADGSTSSTEVAPEDVIDRPVVGPVALEANDQEGDGSEVLVASVTLPSPGYLVVHADAGSIPGQVLGHSELLPEGTSTDVVVPLDEPLAASALLWPMAHLDLNENGTYEFAPPGDVSDGPAQFEDGRAATVPLAYTLVAA